MTREATLNADNGVFSEVFKMLTHPVAKTGPCFLNVIFDHKNSYQAIIRIGKFQGIIYPHTPTGS